MSQLSAAAFAGRMRWVFGGLAGIMAASGCGCFPEAGAAGSGDLGDQRIWAELRVHHSMQPVPGLEPELPWKGGRAASFLSAQPLWPCVFVGRSAERFPALGRRSAWLESVAGLWPGCCPASAF